MLMIENKKLAIEYNNSLLRAIERIKQILNSKIPEEQYFNYTCI